MEKESVKNRNSNNPTEDLLNEPHQVLEAVIFASEDAVSLNKLKTIVPGQPDGRQIRKMIDEINRKLQNQRHPFEIADVAGGYQFRTVPYFAPWVRQLFKDKPIKKISAQGLECLAVIAYKQPITKAEIEEIRGVLSDGAMKTLLERHLITIDGRSDKPGRPLLYSTTKEFLTYFGIKSIADLPKIEEFEEMAKQKMGDLEEEIHALPEDEIPSEQFESEEAKEENYQNKQQEEPPEEKSETSDVKENDNSGNRAVPSESADTEEGKPTQ